MERIKKILVSAELNIKQALKLMDETKEKILFVVTGENLILGTVTDGDIRRWILKGKSLKESVSKVMNKAPTVLKKDYSTHQARELMVSRKIECIPIVDDKNRIISAIRWVDLFEDKAKQCKQINLPVVIMAGGEGVRLSPFTKILPKPLVPIGEKPIVELIMDKFIAYGCNDFYLSLNYKSSLIKAYFGDANHNYKIHYVQEEKPLGTAGSLHLLRSKLKTTFFTSNCDTLIEADYADILEFHKANKNKITLIGSMKHYGIPYGVCQIKNGGALEDIHEKPEYDFLVITGLYVLEPEVIADIPEKKFYHMTDLINDYIKQDKKVGVYPVSEKSWLDLGQWEELQELLGKFKVR